MNFSMILKKYYHDENCFSFIILLKANGLFDEMEQITNRLYDAKISCDKQVCLIRFAQWGSGMMTVFALWLKRHAAINNDEEPGLMIIHFLRILTAEVMKHLKLQANDDYSISNEIIVAEPGNSIWKNFIYSILMENVEIKNWKEGDKNIEEVIIARIIPITFLTWNHWTADKNNKVSLNRFLVELCKLFPGLHAIKKLGLLFDPFCKDYKIILPSAHLFPFLMIFSELHKGKRISCENNRGLFILLKDHLVAPYRDPFPVNNNFSKFLHDQMRNVPKKGNACSLIAPLLLKFNYNAPLEVLLKKSTDDCSEHKTD